MAEMTLAEPLAGHGLTLAKLQAQITDLTARLNAGQDSYVYRQPALRATCQGYDQRLMELGAELVDALQAKHPAQLYVRMATFGEHAEAEIVVDFEAGRASVPYNGQRHEIALENVPGYYIDHGHKV